MKLYNEVELTESFEYVGMWFHPDHKNEKISGKFNYNCQNDLILLLEGAFSHNKYDIINGEAGGKIITLIDCFATNSSFFLSNKSITYSPTRVFVHKILVGIHVKNEDELILEKVYVETEDIKPWSHISGLSDDNNEDQNSFNINYKQPNEIEFYDNVDINIKLLNKLNYTPLFPPCEKILIEESNYFCIGNKSLKKGIFFLRHIDSLRKFISFVSRTEIKIRKIQGKAKDLIEPIFIIYRLVSINLDFKAPDYNFNYMFFTLLMMKKRIKKTYSNWYNFLENAPEPVGLYFYNTRDLHYDKFLSKAQALEDYHRKIYCSKDMGFKRRIIELFEKNIDIMKYTGDKNAFAEYVKDHRDYYSHYFDKKKSKVFKGHKFEYLARDTNLLIELCFLEAMGFDLKERKMLIESNINYFSYLEITVQDNGNLPSKRVLWSIDKPDS